jgi:hypothetical protein
LKKRIFMPILLVLVLLVSMFGIAVPAAAAAFCPTLPGSPVPVYFDGFPTGVCYFWITVSEPGDLSGINGTYEGWCIDNDLPSPAYINDVNATLICSYDPLPMGTVEYPDNLDLVNWMLNNDYRGLDAGGALGIYTWADVQMAYWQLLDDGPYPTATFAPGEWTQDRVDALMALAVANGEGFTPAVGELCGVIVIPEGPISNETTEREPKQISLIGIPVPEEEQGYLKITKVFDPLDSGFTGTFAINYSGDNGASGTVNLAAGESETLGPYDVGTVFIVTEPVLPTAPAGWNFGTPVITGSPATIVAGDEAAAITVTVTNYIEEEGDEGCTPGYWKGNADNWEAVSWVGYAPGDDFSIVFGIPEQELRANGKNVYTDPTLREALDANGSGINLLARSAVAALLNASNPNINFTMTEAEIIAAVQAAIAAGEEAIQTRGEQLDDDNNLGCPIDQKGDPIID